MRNSVRRLGDVEDDGVGMKLRGRISVYGPTGVVLESCRNPLARRLGGQSASNARLDVSLHLVERNAYTFPVRHPNALIAAGKRGQ